MSTWWSTTGLNRQINYRWHHMGHQQNRKNRIKLYIGVVMWGNTSKFYNVLYKARYRKVFYTMFISLLGLPISIWFTHHYIYIQWQQDGQGFEAHLCLFFMTLYKYVPVGFPPVMGSSPNPSFHGFGLRPIMTHIFMACGPSNKFLFDWDINRNKNNW